MKLIMAYVSCLFKGKRLRTAFSTLCIVLIIVAIGGCGKFSRLQKSGDVNEKYNAAVDYYKQKDYYKAAVLFEESIPLLKGTDQAEQAHFYYAYCQYYMKQLTLSSAYFKQFFETFPRSQYAEEANYLYCLSLYNDSPRYYLDQSSTIDAIEAFQNFVNNYPENKEKENCNRMMDALSLKLERKAFENAKLYYKKENYKAANIALENFTKDYPQSSYAEEALFLKIDNQSKYANNSIEEKKLERFNTLVDFYQTFIDRYPSSKYLRSAENLYDSAVAIIAKRKSV